MSQLLYVVNPATQVISTASCSMIGNEIKPNPGVQYDVVIVDLCRALILACENDDNDAKIPLATMLHGVIGQMFSEG